MTPAGASATTRMGSFPLRLRAEDAEDLAVISACVQDALVAVGDFAYDPGAQVFMLAANRFRWEDYHPGAKGVARFERTLCAVTFDNITAAAYRGFQRSEKDRILCLLAMRVAADPANASPGLPPGAIIDLDFAGDVGIRLSALALRVRARDFGDPWPTPWQPGHELPAMN
jgi:Protein of unknown function (DUF2948)